MLDGQFVTVRGWNPFFVPTRARPPGRPLDRSRGRAPFSNAGGIRSSRGGDVPIERRGRDTELVRDLSHADVGIG
jgi:hypothetical protein